MANFRCLLVFATLLAFFAAPSKATDLSNTNQQPSHKHALVIAISKYGVFHDNSRLVPDLDCDADAEKVTRILKNKFHFADSDICILSTPDKTRKADIEAAFDQLIASIKPGDLVFVHYSGHGSQVTDESNRKGDGWADTLCPSDLNIDDKAHEYNMILDKQLAGYVRQISDKNPKLATLMFDCCHSGTITRGIGGITRGFASPDRQSSSRGASNEIVTASSDLIRSPSKNVLVMAACRPDEEANEYRNQMGLFTYAFESVMASYQGQPDYTYQDLASDISMAIARVKEPQQRSQHLMLDGPTTNALMSDINIPSENRMTATILKQNELWLNEGSLGGITAGSKFAIYPESTKQFSKAKPIALAEVSQNVLATKAKLSVLNGDISQNVNGQIFAAIEKEHHYDQPLRIACRNINANLAREIEDALDVKNSTGLVLERSALQNAVKDWNVELTYDPAIGLTAVTDDNRQICSFKLPDDSTRRVEELQNLAYSMRRESLWRVLKSLSNASKLQVALHVIPIEVKELDESGVPVKYVDKSMTENEKADSIIKLKSDDWFRIELTNASDRDLFVNVFDVQPNGTVEPIFPGTGADDSEIMKIAKGQTWKVPGFCQVDNKEFGQEIIKVVATVNAANFRPVFAQTRNIPITANNPLVQLLVDTNNGTRSVKHVDIPKEDWTADARELRTSAK
jgi:metacaspase-1